MYKKNKMQETTLQINKSVEGETIEMKIERIVVNKEPITDGSPSIYTERKDGVQAGYNIKTDRFEIALDAMTAVAKSDIGKRDNVAKMNIVKTEEKNGETEPIQGTNN